jgi:hypothetical protein
MIPAVLLALQDHARRRALHDVVADAGYRVHLAASIREARRAMTSTHLDVVFLDEGLDATGVFVSELRRRQTAPRPRLVRLWEPAAPARPPVATWRPDASLRGDVAAATALELLTMLAPIAGTAPSA